MPVNVVYRNLLKILTIAVLIVLASYIGRHRAQESQQQRISYYFPDTVYNLERVNANKWIVSGISTEKESYIYIGDGLGYNGRVSVLAQTDLDKIINNVIPIAHHETPSFFKKLEKDNYFKRISGKEINSFLVNESIDVVSGATISSIAVGQGIRNGYSKGEGIPISLSNYPVFGFLEFLVLFLLITGFLITKIKSRKLQKYLLWSTMVLSLILLGFVYNQHITLSRVSAILNGYFPGINNELYFYILLFGSILIIIITRKNIYCHSVCPFGVVQDILAGMGNTKPFRPGYYKQLKTLQRLVMLAALLISLAFNNPALAQYEVFGAFFQLTANSIIFGILFISIVLSLFVTRPWCNFLCPIDSVFAYIKLTRNSIVELWKNTEFVD